jgi:hypothetical protein
MRINRQAVFAILLASTFAMGGCKVKRPDDIIAESEMENIIYDYHLAKAMSDELPAEDNYKKQMYIDAVFAKYGITEEKFDSSLVWYTRNTDRLDKIYENVTNRLKGDAKTLDDIMAVREKRNFASVAGDSVDIWAWRKVVPLTNSPMNNLFTFVLAADTNYKLNDKFIWQSDVILADGRTDSKNAPVFSLQLVYENDSIIGVTRQVVRSGRTRIILGDDQIGRIKSINGFIYRPLSDGANGDVIVGNIALMRYHTGDTIIAAKADTAAVDTTAIDSLTDDIAKPAMIGSEEKAVRLTPEEMNRRRTTIRVERPEQIEAEKKIEKEHEEYEKNNRARRLPPSRKR